MAASGGWIQTFGGRQINIIPELFDPAQIVFEDVALALPHMNRYAGHTAYPYSVAQHCIVLARSFERRWHDVADRRDSFSDAAAWESEIERLQMLERWAFIHDWPEFAISDVPAPFKRMMPQFSALDENITNAVAARNGLPTPMPIELMEMDRRLCRNEMDVFSSPNANKWWLQLQPVPFVVAEDLRERTVADVRAEFIAYAEELGVH